MKKSNPSSKVLAVAVVFIVIASAVYVFLYQFEPLTQPWNDFWLYLSFVLAAALAAVLSTMVVLQFRRVDKPRIVWISFAIGLWFWVIAESVWTFYALTQDEMASVTFADFWWVGAYLFFALAFVHQYYLIYTPPAKKSVPWLLGIIAVTLLVTGVITFLLQTFVGETEQTWWETYVTFFYPLGDLAVGLAALHLSRVFGRGQWGRMWWGLIFFAFSDALYSWLDFSGAYGASVEMGSPLSLITDVLYLDAYLLVGLACLAQLLLIRFGPSRRQPVMFIDDDDDE